MSHVGIVDFNQLDIQHQLTQEEVNDFFGRYGLMVQVRERGDISDFNYYMYEDVAFIADLGGLPHDKVIVRSLSLAVDHDGDCEEAFAFSNRPVWSKAVPLVPASELLQNG